MGIVDEERAAALADLLAGVEKKAEGHAAILAGIKRCKEARISVTDIAATLSVTRETVYRWAGESVR